jgi:hypothetical protein
MARKRAAPRRRRGPARAKMDAGIDGLMGGAAASVASQFMGPLYGPAVGLYGVGYWRGNDTLQTLGGVAIGAALASGLQLPGGNAGVGPGGLL